MKYQEVALCVDTQNQHQTVKFTAATRARSEALLVLLSTPDLSAHMTSRSFTQRLKVVPTLQQLSACHPPCLSSCHLFLVQGLAVPSLPWPVRLYQSCRPLLLLMCPELKSVIRPLQGNNAVMTERCLLKKKP